MKLDLPVFPYGGDYNPEQWPESVWHEDMRLMRLAGITVATLPVFGWASLEPEEGIFTFDWLDKILSMLAQENVRFCLATATASVPAWLTQKYPDVLVVNREGVRQKHGNRHTFCPNSPHFRRLSTRLAEEIAKRYCNHPNLMLWHVGNEYGTLCYCEQCAEAFRLWLQRRYGTLDELNERWYTAFWGHKYSDWSQIDTPTTNGEGAIQAQQIDFRRFASQSLLECYKAEKAVLRKYTPRVPITTNLMATFLNLDYHEWAKELDVVSWDSYPWLEAKPEEVAFNHALHRGMREGQPFLLMEQTPSQQNWAPYCTLKAPGVMRLQSYQAVAQGSDSIMFFQWRRGRGGIEKLHGAIVEHGGDESNRVFQEIAALGTELKDVGTRLQGRRVPAKVAVLFSWPNWWGIEHGSGPAAKIDYPKIVRQFYSALHRLGIQADVVSPKANLSPYKVIVAPMLTMVGEEAAAISMQVQDGASLVASFFSAMVDENDRVYLNGAPGPWQEVLGIFVEETDALSPARPQGVRFSNRISKAGFLCDRVRLRGAEATGFYTDQFYAGEAATTRNTFGKGEGHYLATQLDDEGLEKYLGGICLQAGVHGDLTTPVPMVEATIRRSDSGDEHLYLLNHAQGARCVELPAGQFKDLLTGDSVKGSIEMAAFEVRILESQP